MLRRLKSAGGETLVETMAAILVAALSVALLVGGITAAGRINRTARERDEAFYDQLTAAEEQTGEGTSITVTVTGEGFKAEIDANLYGDGDLQAYARAEWGGGTP